MLVLGVSVRVSDRDTVKIKITDMVRDSWGTKGLSTKRLWYEMSGSRDVDLLYWSVFVRSASLSFNSHIPESSTSYVSWRTVRSVSATRRHRRPARPRRTSTSEALARPATTKDRGTTATAPRRGRRATPWRASTPPRSNVTRWTALQATTTTDWRSARWLRSSWKKNTTRSAWYLTFMTCLVTQNRCQSYKRWHFTSPKERLQDEFLALSLISLHRYP